MKRLILIGLVLISTGLQAQTSLSLRECLERAGQEDVALRNASLDVLAAQAQRQEALSLYFPTVSVQAIGFKAFDPLLELGLRDILGEGEAALKFYNAANFVAPLIGYNVLDWRYTALSSGYGAAALAVQPVFAGGRIVAGNRLAVLGVEAARQKEALTARQKASEVEEKYWTVVTLGEKARALDEAVGMVRQLCGDAAAAADAGLIPAADAMLPQVRLRELRSKQVRLRSGIRLAKMDLLDRLRIPYSPYETMATDSLPFVDRIALSDTLETLLPPEHYFIPEDELTASLEELQLLDLQVRAKKLEKQMVVGEALPQIGVGASYGWGDYGIGKSRWNGGVFASVKIPLSDWGRTARKIQRYDFELQKAENQREFLTGQLLLRTRKLWIDLVAAWDEIQVRQESLAYAEATLGKVRGNFDAGLVPVGELLQASVAISTEQTALADARAAYRTALRAYRSER